MWLPSARPGFACSIFPAMPNIRLTNSIVVLAALAGMLSAGEHVQVVVTWKNASAEELQRGLLPVSQRAAMTVADDGKATLYFNTKAPEVAEIMNKAADNLPKDLLFVSTAAVPGDIPAAPAQSNQARITFDISKEKAAIFGVSASDLGARLVELQAAHPDDLIAAFDTAVFSLPDGKKVPVRNLAEIRLCEVKRPLISRKP